MRRLNMVVELVIIVALLHRLANITGHRANRLDVGTVDWYVLIILARPALEITSLIELVFHSTAGIFAVDAVRNISHFNFPLLIL